ncbi:MAG: BatD family protein [Pseudomonadota bacterium]
MNKLFSRIFIVLLSIMICQHAMATVAAHVDRTQLSQGESLKLFIDISKGDKPDLSPLNKDFQVYGTTNSSSYQLINDKRTSLHQLIVTLMPKTSGKLTIPALKVGNDSTQAIQITVSKPSPTQIGGKKSALFMQASTAIEKTYVNAPVLYTIKLYYANNITGGQISPPHSDKLSFKPLGKGDRYTANVHGRYYQVVEQHYLLTPTQSGEITIGPAIFQGTATGRQSNNNFGFFSMSGGRPIAAQSNSVKLDVQAMPSGVSPLTWFPAQAVKLSDTWTLTGDTLTVGTPVTRTINLTALGIDSSVMPDLNITAPDHVNAYPDKTQSQDGIKNNTLMAEKIYKIAYIPTEAGTLTFPPIQIKWWDNKDGTAHVATLAAKQFQVKPAAKTASNTGATTQTPSTGATTPTNTPTAEKIIIEKKTSKIWLLSTIILLILWLLTLLAWFIQNKSSKKKQTSEDLLPDQQNKQQIKLKKLQRQLKSACQKNDAQTIHSALIDWASVYFNDKNIRSLHGIRQHVTDQALLQQLDYLEQAVYRQQTYESGNMLWQCLEALEKQYKQKVQAYLIKPLYPDKGNKK